MSSVRKQSSGSARIEQQAPATRPERRSTARTLARRLHASCRVRGPRHNKQRSPLRLSSEFDTLHPMRGSEWLGIVVLIGCKSASPSTPPSSPVTPVPEPPVPSRTREAPTPLVVTGTILRHCAYGPPNYGEAPDTDAKEQVFVVVLDEPRVVPNGPKTIDNVRVIQIAPAPDAQIAMSAGQRAALEVRELVPAETGHHHTRVLAWVTSVRDVHPADLSSLRQHWPEVSSDFLGTPCPGYPL
jgi:hypothetical protein